MKHRRHVTIILKSCLTGKPVWIYRGPSRDSARIAYWRACRSEVERVRHWPEYAARRASNIARLLSDCMADMPIDASLTPSQEEAARQLRSIGKKDFACHRDFYEHVMEERGRRKSDREIRRRMREHSDRKKNINKQQNHYGRD